MRTRSASRALLALISIAASLVALAAGCGFDNALVGGTCAAGYVPCGLRCVVLASDPENCGACGNACLPDQACTLGVCDLSSDGSAGQPDARTTDSAFDRSAVGDVGSPGDDATVGDARSDRAAAGGDDSTDVGPGESSRDDSSPSDGRGPPGDGGADEASGNDGDIGNLDSGGTDAMGGDSSAPDATDDSSAPDATGDDSTPADATGDDSTLADAPADTASPCTSPLVFCGGQCLDVTGDPLNCGTCNVVCASQLCSNGQCMGAASGGIVYIGHDYATTLAGTAQARVLSNAVFVPSSNPLHVMSYERYASATAINHVDTILGNMARQLGRTLVIHSTTSDDEVRDQLALPTYDVLLVHDQGGAADGALATLGGQWAPTLATFALGGGVVVVLDGGGGVGQMPAFATGTTMLDVSAHRTTAVGTPLFVSSRSDVVGTAVVSPYGAGQSSVSLTTEPNGGNVVYVVEVAGDAGGNAPVVVHKAF
jgi:hypothetical protein